MIGDDDLEAIFSNGDFDTEAVFGGSLKVRGWFTGATQQVSVFSQEIEAVLPTFDCKTSDIDELVARGSSVVIDGTTYKVERKHDLGTGVTSISLKT